MYFLLGFFIMLGLFFSIQQDNQERAHDQLIKDHAMVKAAENEYPLMLASYKSAYQQFDELIEKDDTLPFPRDFRGQWIPSNQSFSRHFIEFNEDGVLKQYSWHNGSTCFSADYGQAELTRYADDHYVASNKRMDDRFIIEGDDEYLKIGNVYRNIRTSYKEYVRIDYREQDQYVKCRSH